MDITTASEIKKEINEGVDFKVIALKYDVSCSFIDSLWRGYVFPNVDPRTHKQVVWESTQEKQKLKFPDVARKEKCRVTKNISKFPYKALIDIPDQDYLDWMCNYHNQRKRMLEVELAKTLLKINAIETNDYSLLSESIMAEIKSDIEKGSAQLTNPDQITETDRKESV